MPVPPLEEAQRLVIKNLGDRLRAAGGQAEVGMPAAPSCEVD